MYDVRSFWCSRLVQSMLRVAWAIVVELLITEGAALGPAQGPASKPYFILKLIFVNNCIHRLQPSNTRYHDTANPLSPYSLSDHLTRPVTHL